MLSFLVFSIFLVIVFPYFAMYCCLHEIYIFCNINIKEILISLNLLSLSICLSSRRSFAPLGANEDIKHEKVNFMHDDVIGMFKLFQINIK